MYLQGNWERNNVSFSVLNYKSRYEDWFWYIVGLYTVNMASHSEARVGRKRRMESRFASTDSPFIHTATQMSKWIRRNTTRAEVTTIEDLDLANYPIFRVEATDAGVYVCRNSKGRVQNVKLVIESKFKVSVS